MYAGMSYRAKSSPNITVIVTKIDRAINKNDTTVVWYATNIKPSRRREDHSMELPDFLYEFERLF